MEVKETKYIKFTDGKVLSFESFFKENFPKFFAFAGKFVEDESECEDIVQEAFIQVWTSEYNVYDTEVALYAFMYKIIRNKCLDFLKHKKVRLRVIEENLREKESEEFLLQSIIDEETRFLLYKSINKLSGQCQQVIRLHLEGKKNQEIAKELGITVATVKFHKSSAYRKLGDDLRHVLLLVILNRFSI